MSNSYNRWSKLAGLPQESEGLLSESVDHQNDETEVRNIVREQIQTMLSEGLLAERAARKEEIEHVQGILNTLLGDNTVAVDGMLGPKTANAIAQLQRDAGLKPDGVIGRKTYAAMASALDAKDMDSEFILGDLMKDVPVIGKAGLVDAPAAPASDRDIRFDQGSNLTVGPGAERDEEVANLALKARGFLDGEKKMSNEEFFAFMDKMGMPLTTAQRDKLKPKDDVGVGDLTPGVRGSLEDIDISKPGLYDDLDEAIYEDIFEEA